MTEPHTRPIEVAGGAPTQAPPAIDGGVPASHGEVPPSDGEVLVRAAGIELLGETPGSGYRNPPALVRRGDGQVITLTPLLQQVMLAVDDRRTVAEVADEVGAASGRLVRPDDVRQLVDSSLRPLGLLLRADGSEPELRRSDPLLALRFRRAVTDPAVTRRLTAPFAALFSPLVVVPVVLAFGVIAGWVLFSQGLAAATAQAFGNPALFLAVVVVTVLSAGFHEFGHAAAARYGGSTPGTMGVGFYLFWPAFYTDVTDSYRLGRAGRVRTDLGGLYFNALVVLAVFAVWWLTGWHAVLLIVATQIVQMIRQLLPLLRFDGYHVLADLTGVPDLYQRIGPIMSGLLPGRWHQPEATALKPWARTVVVLWILLVIPLMVGSLLLMVLALPRVLASAWAGIARQAGLAGSAFGEGDVLGVLARALAVVALVLPILGLGYVLVRLIRGISGSVWRRTEGRPVRRGLALVLAAALVLGLGWAWWPAGDRYRPVRAWEGGTVLDVVPASSSSRLDVGSQGAAPTIWPEDAGPLPTADEPVLAMVLVPSARGGGGTATEAPTWVFPFNRPLAPGEGDNQALAVNTEDGSVLYDVTFALVWADGDTALNRNEAYALASCTDCRTVAVAFQVVLLVGSVDVVVPQNLAAAVNYACVECVTYALATQLVVSLDGPLGESGARDLAAIWAELGEFGERIQDVPLAELRARLTEYEARILAVVRADAEQAGTDEESGTGSPAEESGSGDPEGGTPATGTTGSTRSRTAASPTGSPSTTGANRSGEAPATTSSPTPTTSSPTPTNPAPATGTSSDAASTSTG